MQCPKCRTSIKVAPTTVSETDQAVTASANNPGFRFSKTFPPRREKKSISPIILFVFGSFFGIGLISAIAIAAMGVLGAGGVVSAIAGPAVSIKNCICTWGITEEYNGAGYLFRADITNNTDRAMSSVFIYVRQTVPGRTVPVGEHISQGKILAGIEPGETRRVFFDTPQNAFVAPRDGLVFEVGFAERHPIYKPYYDSMRSVALTQASY